VIAETCFFKKSDVMIKYHDPESNTVIAELEPGKVTIGNDEDIVDIIGNVAVNGCSRVIIHRESFSQEFFDLRTGVAGAILQKISNYRMRLAIVGDFSDLKSKSWKDFIRESNRGRLVSFLPGTEAAKHSLK
jgi:hypothetical protein